MGKYFRATGVNIGRRSSLKRLCLALILGGGILAPLAHATTALAIVCRSDPTMEVNGAVVNVVTTMSTDPSAVREIDYQVTVPSGALIGKLTLTVGLGFPENVTYVYSPTQPAGSIQVAASVITQDDPAPFPMSVQVSSLLAGTKSMSGTSASTITVFLDHLLMP